eukprot:1159566-Pelagomonas_calceolata.AAC.14
MQRHVFLRGATGGAHCSGAKSHSSVHLHALSVEALKEPRTEAKEPVPTPSLEQGLSSSRGAWEKYKATRCDKKAPGPWPSWRAKGSTSQLAALVQQL